MTRPEQVWAGDVLVIGAGAAGGLLAEALQDRFSVTLVDDAGFGAGQSNHSHGYLHHGYIYITGGGHLSRSLRTGAARWGQLLDEAGCSPTHTNAIVGFRDPLAARSARATWAQANLPVKRIATPIALDRNVIGQCFNTREAAYDFTPMFVGLRQRLGPTSGLLAHVRRLRVSAGQVDAVGGEHSER